MSAISVFNQLCDSTINIIAAYTTYNIHAVIYTAYNTYYLRHLQY